MQRAESIFRLVISAVFAICAVGAAGQREWPMVGVYLVLTAIFVLRVTRGPIL